MRVGARRGGWAVFRKSCLLGPSHRSSAAPAANQSAWVNPQPSQTQVATRRARRQTVALEIPSSSPTTTIARPDGNRARRSASFTFVDGRPSRLPSAHCGGPHAAVLRSSSAPVPQPHPRTVKIISPVGVAVSICSRLFAIATISLSPEHSGGKSCLRSHPRTSLQLWLDGVVPLRQSFMALQSKRSNLTGCGLETARIETAVEVGGDLKSGLGAGGASIVENLLIGIQRFARPVS
jgi:hypothetical protein